MREGMKNGEERYLMARDKGPVRRFVRDFIDARVSIAEFLLPLLLLTFVLQDDTGGLQVETEKGWVEAVPRPGTFVVNIGELLELASNGYLKATVHRVVSPKVGRDRYSVAFFLGARLDATVPLLDLPPALAAEAKGPASDPENPLFRNVGANYLKGRLRSHPDVAQRHHADLLR